MMRLNELGSAALAEGRLEVAKDYHQRAPMIGKELDDERGIAISLIDLGLVANLRKKTGKAEEYYQQAFTIREKSGYKEGLARSLFGFGLLSLNRKDPATARDHFQRSLRLFDEVGATLESEDVRSFMRKELNSQLMPPEQARESCLFGPERGLDRPGAE